MAFQSKNLRYEKQEPAFLKRLRGQQGDEKHSVQASRPRNPRLATNAEDDEPTIVNESGESVTQEEYQAMLGDPTETSPDLTASSTTLGKVPDPEDEKSYSQDSTAGLPANSKDRKQQAIVDSGISQKRRKQGRVVGAEDQKTLNEKNPRIAGTHGKPSTQKSRSTKRIKLSFDDEDVE